MPAGALTADSRGILASCIRYFLQQERTLEEAQAQINALLSGDCTARISCDEDGELFKLFHSVNTMAAVMAAHANKETQAKEFLKNTIADISHQLKTPLAALNIYNGLLQGKRRTCQISGSLPICRSRSWTVSKRWCRTS